VISELNTFLLGTISVLLTLEVGFMIKYIKQTDRNSEAITKILTRCAIFHTEDGTPRNRRVTDV